MSSPAPLVAPLQNQLPVRRRSKAHQRERLAAFQEFKEGYCDLYDAADWQYWEEATGLRQATLRYFARYSEPSPALRLFVRPPELPSFEPYHLQRGYVESSQAASVATAGLLAYLRRLNPTHTIIGATSWQVANAA